MSPLAPPPAPAAATTGLALRCPRCTAEMVAFERSGVVIDQCRECRGMFLDRGELERLVDAESGGAGWTGPRMVVPDPRRPSRTNHGHGTGRGYASEWRSD